MYKVSEGFQVMSRLDALSCIQMTTKTHYKVAHRIEVFYAGGAISLSNSGKLIACAYYDEVKVFANASIKSP